MASVKKHFGGSSHSKYVPAGYYWRDYTGNVPEDAVPGGHDVNNKATYIGQVFLSKIGILPGTIYPGQRSVKVPFGWKVTHFDIGVKILCSSDWTRFSWEAAESKNLQVTSIGKHLVVGGFENNNILNVGRAICQGQLIVGKVLGYKPGGAELHLVCGDKEIGVGTYQVLVYNHN